MVGWGLVVVLSASTVMASKATGDPFFEFKQQLGFAVVGLLSMLVISRVTIEKLQGLSLLFFSITVFMQLLVLVPSVGVSVGGNTNWLDLGLFTIQPSEFLKIGIILFLAAHLSNSIDDLWNFRTVSLPILLFGFGSAGLVLVVSQDLGTVVVIVGFLFVMMFLIGMPIQRLLQFAGLCAGALTLAAITNANRLDRIRTFLFPSAEVGDANWQVQHGTWALASGGLTGTGLGNSKMKWGWIPEVQNDFIFAIIGEESGLMGAAGVLVLFFVLARTIRQISLNTTNTFGSIVATGILSWILVQALINIAVVLHLLPVLGVPLPLFSKGGSSMVAVLVGLGIVLAIERDRKFATRGSRR